MTTDDLVGLYRRMATIREFDTVVPRNVRLSEAPSYGLPILQHAPQSAGNAAYLKLAKEVAARG